MKITRVRRRAIAVPLPKAIPSAKIIMRSVDCVLVYLDTDAGITGEGLVFTLNGTRLKVLDEMIASLEPLVVGLEPEQGAAFFQRAWNEIGFLGRTGVAVIGLSAIDMALWDLRGKAANLNVSRLLGGLRETLPVYRSNGLRLNTDIDGLQEEAAGFVKQGFRAVKMSLGNPKIADDVARVKAVREAIGPDIQLMSDCNQQLTAAHAIRLGREIEQYRLAWIEEPVPSHDHAAEAQIAAALDTPIASGENEYTHVGMLEMIKQKSADILMPDMQRMGGPTEMIKVAHLCEAHKVPVSPHLFCEMTLSLAAGMPNVLIGEYIHWFEPLYSTRIQINAEGQAIVPKDVPGWGMSFDADAVERFAYDNRK